MKTLPVFEERCCGVVAALLLAGPFLRAWFDVLPAGIYVLLQTVLLGWSLALCWLYKDHPLANETMLGLGLYSLFISYCLLSFTWGGLNSNDESPLLVVSLIMLGPIFVMGMSESALRAGLYALSALGLICALLVIQESLAVFVRGAYSDKVHENYLAISSVLGASALGNLFVGAFARKKLYKILGYLGYALTFVALAMSLARGALVFVFLISVFSALFLMGPTARRLYLRDSHGPLWSMDLAVGDNNRVGRTIRFILLGVTALLIVFVAIQVERTRTRLLRLISGDELSAGGRGDIWGKSLYEFGNSPIMGRGLGTSNHALQSEGGTYPHNFILQVALETGVIGSTLFLGFCVIVVLSAIRFFSRFSWSARGWTVIGLFYFMEYSKSYDFWTARPLVLSCLIVLGCVAVARTKPRWIGKV